MDKSPRKRKIKGLFLPNLLRVLGISVMVAVILTALPLTLPRLFGLSVYHVTSGSMEPELPEGSVAYTRYLQPELVEQGDVIAFLHNGSVVMHRVVRNRMVEGDYITKGDANDALDPEPVSYGALVGRVEYHVPRLGRMLSVYEDRMGKTYIFMVAASGLMLELLGRSIRERRREERKMILEETILAEQRKDRP